MCELGLGASTAARDLFLQMETETQQRAAWEHISEEAKAQKQLADNRHVECRRQAAQARRKRSPRHQHLMPHSCKAGQEVVLPARPIAGPEAFCKIPKEV
jgi:hypothetical protein